MLAVKNIWCKTSTVNDTQPPFWAEDQWPNQLVARLPGTNPEQFFAGG
jgi:hypothetical protein